MMQDVFIVNTATFLPNEPIGNDEIEDYLGLIGGKESRAKNIVLRNNGIKRRFYALDKNGSATHSNAELAAESIRHLLDNDSEKLKQVDLLCCGTSSPDQMMPSHGVMVHGCLPESNAIEVITPSGNCTAGMHALKYAFMAVKGGFSNLAVVSGSERTSRLLHANMFESEIESQSNIDSDPYIAFEKDFLRWMLSDGAGSFLLSNKKNEDRLNFKIEWVEGVSYANEVETCMYMAGEKMPDGSLKSFKDYTSQEMVDQSIMSIKQDVKMLRSNIIALGFKKLVEIFKTKGLRSDEVDYFLPHMSSEFFREKINEALIENNIPISQEKWFSNLSKVGNVGAGSIFLMVDELMKSGTLKKGEKMLVAVPESARFSYVFALFTVC